jgi:hypothetical protein
MMAAGDAVMQDRLTELRHNPEVTNDHVTVGNSTVEKRVGKPLLWSLRPVEGEAGRDILVQLAQHDMRKAHRR